MMLKADSSAENSDSELHSSATTPTIESVVRFDWIALVTRVMLSTDWLGNTASR